MNRLMKSGLRNFLILWSGQAVSSLGSSMTSFALIIWAYQQQGTVMSVSLLAFCSLPGRCDHGPVGQEKNHAGER